MIQVNESIEKELNSVKFELEHFRENNQLLNNKLCFIEQLNVEKYEKLGNNKIECEHRTEIISKLEKDLNESKNEQVILIMRF